MSHDSHDDHLDVLLHYLWVRGNSYVKVRNKKNGEIEPNNSGIEVT